MSPLLAPDRAEIERALEELLRRDAGARVLAMRSPVKRTWPEIIERRGQHFRVAWCPSELEIRERLSEAEANADGMILLTPLDAAALASDIIARFPRARLEQTDRWSALRSLFKAHMVDPRLAAHRWLADLLLAQVPGDGYRPASGGALDLDTAWRAALEEVLGLSEGRGDAVALLTWTLDPVGLDRLAQLPPDVRQALTSRLGMEAGPAAALVLGAASVGRGGDALAIALACGVVFGEAAMSRFELRDAAVRLEPLVGGVPIDPAVGRNLAEAGRRVLGRLARDDSAACRAVETRTAAILTEIRAERAAGLSPALQLGFDARMREAADALCRATETGHADDAGAAWAGVRNAAGHDRAGDNAARIGRLTMAARLMSWLTKARLQPFRSFGEAAAGYASDGGFVDRARQALRGGDHLSEVANAYARVAKAAATQRDTENQSFATLLRGWNQGGGSGDVPLPVERVLDAVVAPLAHDKPVLLIVFDGLSFAVWRQLAETVGRLGWVELAPADGRGAFIAAAALPSVTEISRASLLCGRLTRGDQAAERAGFAGLASLVTVSRSGKPPRLFHKADLGVGPGLGIDVQAAVADLQQKVVGIVHNAVDAQLSGSDQLEITWSADDFRQVSALLHTARQAGRIIVITSDHGHVVDEGTVQRPGGAGDRWRSAGAPASDGEISLAGGRVLAPGGATSIVVAWSERLRFAARRGGYHGGAAPQEVLVPIAVLSSSAPPSGWTEASPAEPAWWRGTDAEAKPPGTPEEAAPSVRRRKAEPRQVDLFIGGPGRGRDAPAPGVPSRSPAPIAGAPSWIEALLRSESYSAQRILAGRGAPPDDQIRALVAALAARGGRITRAGLAEALGTPLVRIAGFVSAARRVLNLDQAQILVVDGDDVILDELLLRLQFELGSR
ncbi:BREX-2 system phosphatase PglZ [Lichenicoccus sp.]|uniref:BREX-2 system phosphatase PglZ n=1 Tax=Lichenicoccus sp. TaxID=2781899 RepID=UPI003D120379